MRLPCLTDFLNIGVHVDTKLDMITIWGIGVAWLAQHPASSYRLNLPKDWEAMYILDVWGGTPISVVVRELRTIDTFPELGHVADVRCFDTRGEISECLVAKLDKLRYYVQIPEIYRIAGYKSYLERIFLLEFNERAGL